MKKTRMRNSFRVRCLALFLYGFAGLASPSLCATTVEDQKQLYDDGVRAMAQKNLPKARQNFSQLLLMNPKSAELNARLGVIELEQGDQEAAIGHLERAVELGVRHPEIVFALASAEAQFGNTEKAEKYYQDVIQENPKHLGAYNDLAILYYRSGRAEESVKMFEAAVQADPNNPKTLLALGSSYIRSGKPEKALECVTKLRDINEEAKAVQLEDTIRLLQQKKEGLEQAKKQAVEEAKLAAMPKSPPTQKKGQSAPKRKPKSPFAR